MVIIKQKKEHQLDLYSIDTIEIEASEIESVSINVSKRAKRESDREACKNNINRVTVDMIAPNVVTPSAPTLNYSLLCMKWV